MPDNYIKLGRFWVYSFKYHLSMDKLHFIKQKFNELGYRIEAILCFREPVSYADSINAYHALVSINMRFMT